MTLPKDVAEAVDRLDNACVNGRTLISEDAWQTIRAHLLSQDAEIREYDELRERMGVLLTRTAVALKGPHPTGMHSWHDLPECAQALQSRLAAADALLRDVLDSYCASPQLHARIAAHLLENTRG